MVVTTDSDARAFPSGRVVSAALCPSKLEYLVQVKA